MELLPFEEYDRIIVSYSGGKDSFAALLHLLELGIPRDKIELWHQHVDGEPGNNNELMDWPVTEAYVRATGEALGIRVRFQWKHGGFEREMNRYNEPTAGMSFEDTEGNVRVVESKQGKPNTRQKFPQVSADLKVRWCSAYLKIDVAARAINNDPALKRAKILFISGERREESAARAKYSEMEKHRCDNQKRRVDQWRPVLGWREQAVWDIIARWRVRAHPAYFLQWGRLSCMTCIFGDRDQWASVKQVAPERFERIAQYEEKFGVTIRRDESVREAAAKGEEHASSAPEEIKRVALSREYPSSWIILEDDEEWAMPPGAFKRCGGPT